MTLEQTIVQVIKSLSDRLGQVPLSGNTRSVFFLNDNWVLKVPTNDEGLWANSYEARHQDECTAKCKMTEIQGLPCLIAEKLDQCHKAKNTHHGLILWIADKSESTKMG